MSYPMQTAPPVDQDFQQKLQTPTAFTFQNVIEKLDDSITQLASWEARLAYVIEKSGGKLSGVDDPASKPLEDLRPIQTFRVEEAETCRTVLGYKAVYEADYEDQVTTFKEIEKQYRKTLEECTEAQRTFRIAKERGLDVQNWLTQQQGVFLAACETHSQDVFQLKENQKWASQYIQQLQSDNHRMQNEITRLNHALQSNSDTLRTQLNTATEQLKAALLDIGNTQEQVRISRQDNAALSQELDVTLQKKKHAEKTLTLAQQKNNHYETELTAKKHENTQLQARFKRDLNAHQQQNAQLQTKLSNAETQARELQKQLKDAQNLNTQWQVQYKTSQDELESLQVKTNKLGGTRLMTEGERYTYDQKIKDLEDQILHLKNKVEQLEGELQTALFSQMTIRKEPQSSAEALELQEIKQQLAREKRESQEKSKTIDNLNQRICEHETVISALGLENDELKRELKEK